MRTLLPAAVAAGLLLAPGLHAAGQTLAFLDPGNPLSVAQIPDSPSMLGFLRHLDAAYPQGILYRTEGIEDQGAHVEVDGNRLSAFRAHFVGGVRVILYTDGRRAAAAGGGALGQGGDGPGPRTVQAVKIRSTDDDEGIDWLATMVRIQRAADAAQLPDGSVRMALALAARIEDHKDTGTVDVAVLDEFLPALGEKLERRLDGDRAEVGVFEAMCHELDMSTGMDLTFGAAGDRLARRALEALDAIVSSEPDQAD